MAGERILIVDDEVQIRRALQLALGGHGYQVEVAAGGDDGLAIINERAPDLVVLDLAMPDRDGLSVIEETRGFSQVPIIVLSAHGQEQEKVRALDLGADDFLTKPFGVNELLARIRALLRRQPLGQVDLVRIGDVDIDIARHVVRKAGVPIHLTPSEFDLLREFALHAGAVLTHRQLLERVRGAAAAENSQQLRVFIGHLRRKLEDDPARPNLIETVPGIGYRLKSAEPEL